MNGAIKSGMNEEMNDERLQLVDLMSLFLPLSTYRSYIINPYQMVKDHRTGVELGDVNRVLEQGELEPLIEAALAQKD